MLVIKWKYERRNYGESVSMIKDYGEKYEGLGGREIEGKSSLE